MLGANAGAKAVKEDGTEREQTGSVRARNKHQRRLIGLRAVLVPLDKRLRVGSVQRQIVQMTATRAENHKRLMKVVVNTETQLLLSLTSQAWAISRLRPRRATPPASSTAA